jgi:4-amino-4-deoxy-L-arabinose transferase-like glycosyltransferase
MMLTERIQTLIHKLEEESGARWLNYLALLAAVAALALWYDTHCYLNFSAPEAMDAAQVARNIAEGHGYSTEFVRPFSVYLLQKHHRPAAGEVADTNAVDAAQVYVPHPDLANAPLYPYVLAGLMKVHSPDWKVDLHAPFWSAGGRFARYRPEFAIAMFNQFLLLVAVWLTFLMAKAIFDAPAAWLAALMMLGSDKLWRLSVSGLPVLLLLVIFLGLAWCLASFETLNRLENPSPRRQLLLAAAAGLLVGLGMMTRYAFGWLLVPVIIYFILFGGGRRATLAGVACLVFAATVAPWIARNLAVSGTLFGTAGYTVVEGTFAFPGSRLMQSVAPDMTSAHWLKPYLVKLMTNLRSLIQDEIPRLGGGWIAILFLAGLLLGLRNVVARRLRYFTLLCLGVFLVATALGRTEWSVVSPDLNTEDLLVLLTPLVIVFGMAFFLTLLGQMELPFPQMRYLVAGFVIILMCLQFILTLLPPKTSPSAYPPYYPPDIQKVSAWMQPNELLMSDIP